MQETLGAGEVGETIPPNDLHAISVSLPTWEANLGWGTRDQLFMDKMSSGYPRFFIHRSITTLADAINLTYGDSGDSVMLFPSRKAAEMCVDFLCADESQVSSDLFRIVDLVHPHVLQEANFDLSCWLDLYAVVFPAAKFKAAKVFWQHTGLGISSRRAEFHRRFFDSGTLVKSNRDKLAAQHKNARLEANQYSQPATTQSVMEDQLRKDLMLDQSKNAKLAIRERIAQSISSGRASHSGVNVSDVYLYTTGMSAMYNVHRMLLAVQGRLTSVCYGFNYLDNVKILTRFGHGCVFYGHCTAEDLDELGTSLQSGKKYLAIFCEFPNNPLLITPDMKRILKLADEHDLIVVVDETLGTFVNVDILSHADIICTSLSKIFSGRCNVMGGSVILNARRPNYPRLKAGLESIFVDEYFPLDAIVMEKNSRDFESRIMKASRNAEVICDFLQSSPKIKWIRYPKYSPTRAFYDECRRPAGGYGYLLTFRFHKSSDAIRFLDVIDVPKGPSLGTNFTLVSPYTLLAHYAELEWAAEYGVVEDLIRISVGIEDIDVLLEKIKTAMDSTDVDTSEESVTSKPLQNGAVKEAVKEA